MGKFPNLRKAKALGLTATVQSFKQVNSVVGTILQRNVIKCHSCKRTFSKNKALNELTKSMKSY